MNRILYIITLLIAGLVTNAQEWEQLPYAYARTTQSSPVIYTSKNNVLVAGIKNNASPLSHISLDGGTTWNQIFSNKSIASVEFGPDGTIYFIPTQKYLSTSNYVPDTIYSSTDGVTWKNMGYKLLDASSDHEYTISGNNTLLFPRDRSGTSKVFHTSTDNGNSWKPTAVRLGPIACSYSADTIIVSSDSPWPGLNRYSHDGGVTVHDATGIGAKTIPVLLPNGDVYAATAGNQVYKSTDGGKSYSMVTLNSNVKQIVDFKYAANGKFYIQVINGIWETTDFENVTAITATLPNWEYFRDMDISDNYVYAISDTSLYRYQIQSNTTPDPDPNPTTSAEQLKQHSKPLKVYPNPSTGFINIEIEGQAPGLDTKVEVFNLQGQLIISKSLNSSTFDASGLSNGVYLLKVTSRDKTGIERLYLY
jgi:hypothetical protein